MKKHEKEELENLIESLTDECLAMSAHLGMSIINGNIKVTNSALEKSRKLLQEMRDYILNVKIDK